MEAVQTIEPVVHDPPTFESVWALLKEVAENQKETDRLIKENARRQEENRLQMKETDRLIKENARWQEETSLQIKETGLQMKETNRQMKETDRQMKETDRKLSELGKGFGNFTNSFGDVIEHMVAPNLQDKLFDLGWDFQMACKGLKFHNRKNDIKFQVDVFLENGEFAMLVEIKATLTIGDINDHNERLIKMRKYADLRGDKRTFLAAVAGITISDDAKEYALTQGFFLIEPTGEDFCIIPPYNKPKEW